MTDFEANLTVLGAVALAIYGIFCTVYGLYWVAGVSFFVALFLGALAFSHTDDRR